MKRTLCVCAAVVVATAVALVAQAPRLEVNPYWPQPLPNHWVFGSITGVAVDAQDSRRRPQAPAVARLSIPTRLVRPAEPLAAVTPHAEVLEVATPHAAVMLRAARLPGADAAPVRRPVPPTRTC